MVKPTSFPLIALCSLAALTLACRPRQYEMLPDGINSVNISLEYGEWTVTVRNKYGSASDTIFAANDSQRSNIYLTSEDQLVVIEKGGSDAFFKLGRDSAPEALPYNKFKERDTRSDDWRYLGVIRNGTLIPARQEPECIALLGAGSSPYRRRYQAPGQC